MTTCFPGKTLIHRAGCTTLLRMKATTFKQRLKLGKQQLRQMKAAGQPLELTRPWSLKSLKELSKALEGSEGKCLTTGGFQPNLKRGAEMS